MANGMPGDLPTIGDSGPCQDIGWLNGIALKFIIYIVANLNFSNTHITIHSDNKGVIGTFNKGSCSNFEINLSQSTIHSTTVVASHNIIPHVKSKWQTYQNFIYILALDSNKMVVMLPPQAKRCSLAQYAPTLFLLHSVPILLYSIPFYNILQYSLLHMNFWCVMYTCLHQ